MVRILEVIHDYLPAHAAGSEIYTASLCRALAGAGHDVAVFTCEQMPASEQFTLTRRCFDGIPVFEAVYNRIYHDLSEQWDDPRMAAVFAAVLDELRPDVVHVQGLQFVGGTSALQAAADRGVPVVVTLHDYWWLCPRAGLMYDLEGRACETAEPAACAACVDVYPVDRGRWSDEAHAPRHADLGDRRWFARALEQRLLDLRRAAGLVHRFIAPSRFLARRFVQAGFPEDRVVVADYGFPAVVPPAQPPPPPPLRVGYVGTLSDYKGVTVLARAVARCDAAPDRLQATIHGDPSWFPAVGAELAAIAADEPRLELAGPFDPARRDEVYASLHLLVVPSLWWENSPLTIHEAWQRGVPVLASDRGGMAELLSRGGGGTFPPGDTGALAAWLDRLAGHPDEWQALVRAIPTVRPIVEDVRLLERLAAGTGRG